MALANYKDELCEDFKNACLDKNHKLYKLSNKFYNQCMKKIEVKVRYLFEGTYTVAADDRNEARTMVTRDCGLVLGGNIHTTLDDDEVDWEFDVHPDMQILSYTELEKKQKSKK